MMGDKLGDEGNHSTRRALSNGAQAHRVWPCRAEPGLESSRGGLGTWSGVYQIFSPTCRVHAAVCEREGGSRLLGQLFLWVQRGRWPCVHLEEKLSARKEINDGVALGSDLTLPLFCLSGRSARREVKHHTVDTRLGGTANRAKAEILCEGIRHEHEDQRGRNGNLSNSKVIVSMFRD